TATAGAPVGAAEQAAPTAAGSAAQGDREGGPSQQSPGDFVYFRSSSLGTLGNRSEVGDPSVDRLGRAGFQTGNWYAAVSRDHGSTFRYVARYTTSPASGSFRGGFCCDQRVASDPIRGMALWYLQYRATGSSGSDTNGVRLAAARSAAD